MTGKSNLRYSNSTFFYHLINWCTYLTYRFLKIFIKPKRSNENVNPLIITGLFRSGTTITSRIINDLGFSAGPDNHLLKAIGSRKTLNPNGFLENHFCMEQSMFLFKKTNSWGDKPPSKEEVENIKLNNDDDNEMVYFSLVKIHDDRITNFNKLKVQLNGSVSNPKWYFNSNFRERAFIKNPHIAVLFPFFKKIFPLSLILVVFRNPFDAVNSAKRVTPSADYNLYNSYYEGLCSEYKKGNKNILFFSYDNLILQSEISIKKLAVALDIKNQDIRTFDFLRKKEISGLSKLKEVPNTTLDVYNFMFNNCINQEK